jgi:hypothetical protein
MNTTQNIQRSIAAAIIAASAGLALSSCAEQRQPPVSDTTTMSQAEAGAQRTAYLDLAARRAEMSRSLAEARAGLYRDLAERRIGLGGPVVRESYRDLAERRIGLGGPVVRESYRDLAERRIGLGEPVVRDSVHRLTER